MKPSLSVCIIAKNEEKNIIRCLESVDEISDEIILLDTGSTDDTVNIVKSFPKVKIFKTTWKNDYSISRNECLSYATGDWIFSIDADEELYSGDSSKIINLMNQDFDVFLFKIISYLPYFDTENIVYRDVLFRNSKEIRYVKSIHEHIERKKELKFNICDNVSIKSKSESKDNALTKSKMHMEMLFSAIENTPSELDKAHYFKHLAFEFRKKEDSENELKYYLKCYEIYKSMKIINRDYMAITFNIGQLQALYNKNYEEAMKYIYELLDYKPNNPDSLFYLAYCKRKMGEIPEAIKLYNQCKDISLNIENEHFSRNITLELDRCYGARI